MATASSSPAARATMPSAKRAGLRRFVPATVTIVGIAALLRVVYDPWYLNYDARYALLWARDAWDGFLPDFKADFAPTPHPLSTLWSSLGLPFGSGGDFVTVWIVLLAFGALVWLTFRLGEELFGRWAGVAAALVVLTRPVLDRDVLLAYQDVPFAALIVGAVLLEARRRRRGVPVLVLLAFAGLLRPEAWVLSGLYFLWMWPAVSARRRFALAALVGAAPVVWMLMDLIVTGDPLHSLHGTAELAKTVDRRRSVSDVPYWSVKYFGFTLREPVILGIPIGLAFAWRRRLTQSWLPVIVAGAMTLVFAIGPIFGLPLIARYIRTPAVLLTVFFGLALFGWMSMERGRERQLWAVAAAVVVGVFVAFLPTNLSMLDNLRDRSAREGAFYQDLKAVGQAPRVRAAFARCGPLTTSDHRPIPYIRWWLDGDPKSVRTVEQGTSPLSKLLLVPRRSRVATRFYQENFPTHAPPPTYQRLYANRTWAVFAAPGCS